MEGPLKKLATRASETLGSNSNRRRPLDPNQDYTSSSTGRESLNQFVSLYKVSKIFMLPTGLWKIPISTDPTILKLYSIYSVSIQLVYILFNISMMIRLVEIFRESENEKPGLLYHSMTLTIVVLEINYKVWVYLKNKIPLLFFTVVEAEERILKSKDNDVQLIYFKQVHYYKSATFCQCFCSGFGISWFILLNLYRKYVQGIQENFMYELWFPFDKQQNATIVTVYNIFIAIYGFFFVCAVQMPMQTLMVFSTSQLRILQLKLRNAFAEEFSSEQEKVDYIKGLIKEHQFLIRFTKTLNDGIKNIILLEFALESINGAGALLQVVSVKSKIEIPFSMIYLIILVIKLGFITWNSNEIIVQSFGVASSVYESNWMDQSESIKKLLHIMLMRAQRPLSIDVGPFMQMDTQAALMSAKGSYTYASMMFQLRSRK